MFKRTLPVAYKFVIMTFTESNRAVPTGVLFIDKKAECNAVNTHIHVCENSWARFAKILY